MARQVKVPEVTRVENHRQRILGKRYEDGLFRMGTDCARPPIKSGNTKSRKPPRKETNSNKPHAQLEEMTQMHTPGTDD